MKNIISIILSSLILLSCAQFVPPTGGKRDIIPPKLVKSIPEQKERNYTSKEITLVFDELIDISSLSQELITVPQLEGTFTVKNKNNEIKIILDKKLKESTTYTFNFREGIKDLNERNPAKNLKLVFSTGNLLDTLGLTGNIKSIYSKENLKDILVELYSLNQKDTLKYYQRKPNYFINTDSSGNFKFENIKANKYRILAIDDKNTNLIWDKKTEQIGFITDTIDLKDNSKNINLELYRADLNKAKIKRSIARENNFSVLFDKPIKEIKVEPLIHYDLKNQTELLFYNYKSSNQIDTTIVSIYTTDSLNNDTTFTQKVYFQKSNTTKKPKVENLQIKTNFKLNEEIVTPITYQLTFDLPIEKIDITKIKIRKDTLTFENFTIINTNENHTKFELKPVNQNLKNKINLIIESNAFTNIKGDTNNIYFLSNQILDKSDLGLIEGSIKDTSGTKIVELYNVDKSKLETTLITKEKFLFKDLIPGNYEIKVIYDKNSNGIWDPGNIDINSKPEDIHIPKTIFKVKSNFELRDIKI